ncbi:MAG: AMP-binding protein, partial [Verrucomicrobiota bacterium]
MPDQVAFDCDYNAEQPAYVIYTSGSTGQPKGVVISHSSASNTINDINSRFNITSKDSILALAQLGFDLSVYDVFGVLAAGGKLVFPQPDRQTDPSHWVALMHQHKVTIWDTVPALMQMLVTYLDSEKEADLPAFRLALLSGDWIPLTLPDRLKKLLPKVQLISLGGATEASIWSIYHTYNGLQPDWTSIPYGRPLANQGFRVLDKDLRDCPEWAIGELYITGQGLAIEYFNDPEMTEARFFEHPRDGQRLYRTGDLGRYLPGGEIEFLGREDNQVKIRGHRIELGEIESALQQHASVGNAKVVLEGKEEERALMAFVEPAINKDRNTDKESQYFQKITAGIEEQASVHMNGLNRESVEEAMHNLDTAVFYSMLRAMHNMDFFHPEKSSTLEEILNSDQILPKNHWLVRRWVSLLTDKNLLNQQKDEGLQCMVDATEKEENEHWEKAASSWTADMGSAKFIEYIRNNTRVLPELLNGKQDPVALLFPEGSDEYVEALYFENAMVNYLNKAICALLARLADEKQGHLRILEIGAGTGATTIKIIEHLKTYSFDYLFTDVASAFVSAAKSKFSSVENMRFGVYDVDKDYRKQGLAPNSFDVIVAAGVLENSRNIPNALQQIKELVCPNGWFVYTEPTLEHPWILASQAFMMQEPQDELRLLSSYLDRQSWYDLTAELGKGPVFHLPKPEDHISRLGVHLYATQLKNERTTAEADSIMAFLQKKVPPYMVPS